ncbi:hypothetical protein [uncultured Anaerofustis sp.]|uniref:hypothetical protein n=1 Tax=uncultured Anaerofustis sp. TaxID=904996 RepID=UPI0025F3CE88|nr:hypothetical protein [uncultured Anaerofustis sp.]
MIVIRLICALCLHIKDPCYDGGYKNRIGSRFVELSDRVIRAFKSFKSKERKRVRLKTKCGTGNEVFYDGFL